MGQVETIVYFFLHLVTGWGSSLLTCGPTAVLSAATLPDCPQPMARKTLRSKLRGAVKRAQELLVRPGPAWPCPAPMHTILSVLWLGVSCIAS